MNRTRPELLTDLAEAVDELTKRRVLTEYREVTVTDTAGMNARRKRRTRRRVAHRVILPGLLTSLEDAAVPGAGEVGVASGGFESRPSAELEPLSVLREITDEAGALARRFGIRRATTLAGKVRALVGLSVDDYTLAQVARIARRWVKHARQATGIDPQPRTINQPCPYCWTRNALTISGDLDRGDVTGAICSNCRRQWDHGTIGLLAEMLTANQTRETMPDAACWWPDCDRRGVHDEHRDARGRVWRDSCRVEGSMTG